MINKDEETELVRLLTKLEPGFLPIEVFLQVARLVVLSIVEVVPLRFNNGIIEVLLLDRGPYDKLWPGELHVPGTVIRPTDIGKGLEDAFNRILQEELSSIEASKPVYVDSILHDSKRGMENSQIYWIEVSGEPKVGKFYSLDNLPDNVMQSQLGFINQAADNFKGIKKLSNE